MGPGDRGARVPTRVGAVVVLCNRRFEWLEMLLELPSLMPIQWEGYGLNLPTCWVNVRPFERRFMVRPFEWREGVEGGQRGASTSTWIRL